MRLCFAFLAPVALAGCAQAFGPPPPMAVSLLETTLTVHFADGVVCRADVGTVPAGQLAGCAYPLDYAVEVHHAPWLKGAEAFFEPYADVTLTRPETGRRWHWKTPQGDAKHPEPNYGTVAP